MAAEQEVVVIARFAGTTEFIRNAGLVTESMAEMQAATAEFAVAEGEVQKRSWMMNQALFTLRRLAYASTLVFVAAGVEAVKMGFNFNSAMQQARVALQPVAGDIGGVHKRLISLFNFTKYTPFQFKDVTIAFRQMYLGMRTVGISANEVQTTLHSVTDALSATGRTTPGTLNRVAVALQHMAYQGHLTGYSVNQLARDGIPIFAALRKELGLTGDQLHQVGSLGIPTQVALKAINRYIETTPGLMNAAYRQATGTLHGLFTTFKDNVSQLMGGAETGLFSRIQGRLVEFNKWMGGISPRLNRGESFYSIIGSALGGGVEFALKQLVSDLTLVWKIFTQLVKDIATSKSTWGALISALVLLHGVLSAVNWILEHFGWIIKNVVIPYMIIQWTWTKTLIIWETIRKFLIAATVAETDALTFSMIGARLAMTLYYLTLGKLIAFGITWEGVLSAINVLMTGTAIGNEYRALTGLELLALKLRNAFLALRTAVMWVVGEMWDLTAAVLADPLFWVVAAIVLFGILYWKVKAFRDAVNWVIKLLWDHPILAALTPVIGPLIMMTKLTWEIYKNFKKIKDLVEHPWHMFSGITHGSWWRNALHVGGAFLGIPGLASGGVVTQPGTVLVGEYGPELLRLPQAATVQPLGSSMPAVIGGGNTNAARQPIQIQFVVGQRVLEQAIVDIIGGRLATT